MLHLHVEEESRVQKYTLGPQNTMFIESLKVSVLKFVHCFLSDCILGIWFRDLHDISSRYFLKLD